MYMQNTDEQIRKMLELKETIIEKMSILAVKENACIIIGFTRAAFPDFNKKKCTFPFLDTIYIYFD